MGDPAMGWMPCVLFLLLRHTCLGLEVTAPSAQVASFHSPALLPCTFTIGAPSINLQFLAIIWYYGDKELLRFDNKEKVVKKGLSFDEQEARKGTVSLTIHNVTIADQGTYKCLVIYSPNRQQREIRLDVHATPEVKIQRKALRKDAKNPLYCAISGFFPQELRVTWLRNNVPIPERSEMGTYQTNADGTYSINSSVVLTPAQIQDRPSITCQVVHVSLQGPIQDAFTVQYGVAPKVRLIPTRTSDKSELMYACEARGFSPEPLSIHWLVNGKTEDPSRGGVDGVFNKNIYYQINLKEDNIPERISCSVQHETLANPVVETIEVDQFNECTRHCHSGLTAVVTVLLVPSLLFIAISGYLIMKKKCTRRFQVSHIHQDQIWPNDNMVTLYCMALNCPKAAEATWTVTVQGGEPIKVSDCQQYKDEEAGPLLHKDYTMRTDKVKRNGLSSFTTKLSFNPEASEYKNVKVTCMFFCGRKSKERSHTCTFTIKKPEFKDSIKVFLDDNKDVVCSATLEKFYPRNIQIQWSYGADQYTDIESTEEEITRNTEDHSYKAVSKCKIPRESLQKSSKVQVTWKHQSMDEPDSREMSLAEIPQRPVMEDIVVPSLVHGTAAKLQCGIRGYFPKDLKVTWLRREAGKSDLYEVSSSDKYKIPVIESTQQSDKTYTCTASLILSVSAQTDQGSEFICRVTHPSLETHLEKRTGELSVEGIPVVKKILQKGKYIVLEVDSFSTQDLIVTWEKADKQSGPYKRIKEKYIHNNQTRSSDGSFSLTSTLESAGIIDIKTLMDIYFKVTIEHGALKTPEEIVFYRFRGNVYIISGNEKEPLEKVKEKEPMEKRKEKEPMEKGKEKEQMEKGKEKESLEKVKEKEPLEKVKEKEPLVKVKEKEPLEKVKEKEPLEKVKEKESLEKVKEKEPLEKVKEKEPLENVNKDTSFLKSTNTENSENTTESNGSNDIQGTVE